MLAAETRHVSGRSRLLHSATALGRRKGWAGGDVRCQSARIAASATVGSEWCGRSRPKLCSAPARLLSSIEVGLCGRFGRPCVEHAQSGRAARCETASTHRPWRRVQHASGSYPAQILHGVEEAVVAGLPAALGRRGTAAAAAENGVDNIHRYQCASARLRAPRTHVVSPREEETLSFVNGPRP